MLAIENVAPPFGEPATMRPACPNCGRTMHVMRIVARTGGLANLRTCSCGECGVSLTEAVGDGGLDERVGLR